MSEENIETMTKSDSNFAPTFVDHHLLPDINLINNIDIALTNNISVREKVINLYNYDTQNPQLKNLNADFTLGNSLF